MPVPILKQGKILIASARVALSDDDWAELRVNLSEQVGRHRSAGVIIDVTALDVLDSFAARTLRTIGQIARLRGAETVIAGIQPDVALSMAQLGLASRFEGVATSLDLEDALELLGEMLAARRARRRGHGDG